MLWKCEPLSGVPLGPKGHTGMGSRLVEKEERKYLLLCLQLYCFIMAVENLYNTAVEYHSVWAAGPPTHFPGPLNPSISPAQRHFRHKPVHLLVFKHNNLNLEGVAEVSAWAFWDSDLLTAVTIGLLLSPPTDIPSLCLLAVIFMFIYELFHNGLFMLKLLRNWETLICTFHAEAFKLYCLKVTF